MQTEDCQTVAELQSRLDYSGWSEKQWREALEHYPCAWVVLTGGCEIIGYIIFQASVSQVELLNLGIKQQYQGKGIANELLQATISLLPESSENVFLEVRRSNVPAIHLYEKVGFHSVGVRRDYYSVAGGSREDALIYRLDL